MTRGWLADQILSFLQRRCTHPGGMVAADVLEGCVIGLEVRYCRRCGAIKTDWSPGGSEFAQLDHAWRRPDPNLWRGWR
jgi:phage baseplate assembly protein gpV